MNTIFHNVHLTSNEVPRDPIDSDPEPYPIKRKATKEYPTSCVERNRKVCVEKYNPILDRPLNIERFPTVSTPVEFSLS